TPSIEGAESADFPLVVSSTGLNDDVTFSATSDPEGLDFSFSPPKLGPENDSELTLLTIKPQADAQPRDYRVDITAKSGDTESHTSFLVSLTCDPPFIFSLAASQPQSQSVTRNS